MEVVLRTTHSAGCTGWLQIFFLTLIPFPFLLASNLDHTTQLHHNKGPPEDWVSTEYNFIHPGEYRLTFLFPEELQIDQITFFKAALKKKKIPEKDEQMQCRSTGWWCRDMH